MRGFLMVKIQKQKLLFGANLIDINGVDKVKKRKVVFKKYSQTQEFLLPKNLEEEICDGHVCRLISKIIDEIDLAVLFEKYKGGGASAYNPRMLLKIWILGFINNIYSSRNLAKQTRENITFMWISGKQTPDFRTLNNFRNDLGKNIKVIFKEVVLQGISLGIISGKDIFVDHTKKEANANKHKIVWRKQVERQMKNIDEELDKLFKYIDEVNEKEDSLFGDKDLPEKERQVFDHDKIKEIANRINEKIKNKKMSKNEGKEIKKNIRRTAELIDRKNKYLAKKKMLNGRNSYSKIDTDAVAMMMKDKLSIKPAYNEGIAVENGFVVNYIISNNCGDVVSFIPLMNGVIENLDKTPETTTADGAYGNEETHSYMEQKNIGNYLKYNSFYRESKKNQKNKKFVLSDFVFNSHKDEFTCKQGNKLTFSHQKEEYTKSDYEKKIKVYSLSEKFCMQCPLKEKCTEGKARSLNVSWEAERLKVIARQNLNSEKGKELRSRRANEVESIFGDKKLNKKAHRYLLRGIQKVNIEAGLYYIAHNIRKIKKKLKRNYCNEMKKQDCIQNQLPNLIEYLYRAILTF